MFVPKMIYADVMKGISTPLRCNVTNMPIVADELCIIAVKINPASSDRNGFSKVVRIALKEGLLASSFNGVPITVTPKNKTPNPRMENPIFLMLLFLKNRCIIMPTKINSGAI
jgi:hypothetical protein